MDDVPGDTIGNNVSDRVRQRIDMIDDDIPGIGVLCNPVARERQDGQPCSRRQASTICT